MGSPTSSPLVWSKELQGQYEESSDSRRAHLVILTPTIWFLSSKIRKTCLRPLYNLPVLKTLSSAISKEAEVGMIVEADPRKLLIWKGRRSTCRRLVKISLTSWCLPAAVNLLNQYLFGPCRKAWLTNFYPPRQLRVSRRRSRKRMASKDVTLASHDFNS